MEGSKLDKQLKLMVLLTQNMEYTSEVICERMEINKRSFYRYLEQFRSMGFVVEKAGRYYRLDKQSPFFRRITEMIHFSESEAVLIRDALSVFPERNAEVKNLRAKLARLYDFDILKKYRADRQQAENVENLYKAIKMGQMVVLRSYSSPNSNRQSDRIVEPYRFLGENTEVLCYEIDSRQNKSFKVARIGEVERMDLLWANREKHHSFYTDIFHFSGESCTPVTLVLGRLSVSLLKEEYPEAAELLIPTDDDRWSLTTEVCSFKGVGRFVLGLWEDIEVVDSPLFLDFLRKRIALLTQKFEQ